MEGGKGGWKSEDDESGPVVEKSGQEILVPILGIRRAGACVGLGVCKDRDLIGNRENYRNPNPIPFEGKQRKIQTCPEDSLVLEGDQGDPPEATGTEEDLRLEVARRETVVQGLADESFSPRKQRARRQR